MLVYHLENNKTIKTKYFFEIAFIDPIVSFYNYFIYNPIIEKKNK